MTPRRRRPSMVTRYDDDLIVAVALAAALAAGLAPAAPSGLPVADALFRAGAAGLVTLAASRARRWATLVLAAAAFAVAHDWLVIPAGIALLLSFVMTTRRVRVRLAGAVVVALAVQVLLRQEPYAFHGASSLVGIAAVLPVLVSAHRGCRSPVRRQHRRIVAAVSGVALLATAAFGVALLLARHDLEAGASRARDALAAARDGDTITAEQELSDAGASLGHSASLTSSWWAAPARALPFVGQQAKAVSMITEEGRKVVRSAKVTAGVGDYRRLKYQTGRVDVARLIGLRRPIAASAAALARADRRLAKLDRGWLLAPLRQRIDDFGREIARATPEAALASSLIDSAPDLLGADGTRHY